MLSASRTVTALTVPSRRRVSWVPLHRVQATCLPGRQTPENQAITTVQTGSF